MIEKYAWIARLKGFLIVLVVLGHVIGAGRYMTNGIAKEVLEKLYECIYSFHMPAFFIIAGMCWHRSEFKSYCKKKAFRLLVPYFVFGVLSIIIYAFVFGYDIWWQPVISLLHAGAWPAGAGFKANSVLWFLPCMFSVLMVYWWLDMLLPKKWQQLAILLALVLVQRELSMSRYYLPWALGFVPWYLMFVVLGKAVSEFKRGFVRVSMDTRIALLLAMGLATCIPLLYFSDFPWADMRGRNFIAAAVYSGLAALVAQLIEGVPGKWISALGDMSLGIMLTHKFFVVLLQTKVSLIKTLFAKSVAGTFLATMIVTIVSLGLSFIVSKMIRRKIPVIFGEAVVP